MEQVEKGEEGEPTPAELMLRFVTLQKALREEQATTALSAAAESAAAAPLANFELPDLWKKSSLKWEITRPGSGKGHLPLVERDALHPAEMAKVRDSASFVYAALMHSGEAVWDLADPGDAPGALTKADQLLLQDPSPPASQAEYAARGASSLNKLIRVQVIEWPCSCTAC